MSRNVLIVEGGDLSRALVDERPDLIVMRLHLPGGSGIDARPVIRGVIRTRAALRHTPIIAMTTHHVSTDEAEIKDAGCTAFVAKPLRVDEFTALARRYIDRPAA